ncbi:tubulin polymerization-promoting protein homolog [Centruroides vittatus]|uniref:tubulin polymerization-promoting protein homolog n=1 Tax=Centruroides vittatus TaxID=120091 RepID=UPI00350F4A94
MAEVTDTEKKIRTLSTLETSFGRGDKQIKKLKNLINSQQKVIGKQKKKINVLEKIVDEVTEKEKNVKEKYKISTKEGSTKHKKKSVELHQTELPFNHGDNLEVHQMASPSSGPSSRPETPTQAGTLEDQFKLFAKFGDSKNTGEAITLSNSDKWFKQAKVIDGKTVTTTDTGIYFKKVAKTKRALTKKEYLIFLETIATNKKVNLEEMKEKLSSCGPPGFSGTTPVASGGAVSRLTDHTKFTGTHKQRFDHSGKGKGKEGRVDLTPNSGYVQGYKAEGSYNKTH